MIQSTQEQIARVLARLQRRACISGTLCSDVDTQREALRRWLSLLPRPSISKFDLSKALLHGLEVPGMASTSTRRAANELKKIVE